MKYFEALAIGLLLAACAQVPAGSPGPRPDPGGALETEIPFEWLAAELVRFDPPLRLGSRERAPVLREGLRLRVAVSAARYDALPPDIAAFLYVGQRELRPFRVERPERGAREGRVVLTFLEPEGQRLEDGAPMVLTIDHGAPVLDPERFRGAPRFERSRVVDRR